MASWKEYCEKLSTTQLQSLIREECEGRGNLDLETLLQICQVLADRNDQWPSYRESVLQLCRNYLEG